MRNSLLIVAVAAVTVFAACSGGGQMEKERKYTPVYLYFNPIDPDLRSPKMAIDLSPLGGFSQFVNYPNDWAKYGLRGNVSKIQFVFKGFNGAERVFDNAGRLRTEGGPTIDLPYAVYKELRYDNLGRLVGVVGNLHRNRWATSSQQFEYDETGKLVKLTGALGGAEYQEFYYYEDGTLKEIIPKKDVVFLKEYDHIGKMEFNEQGKLVRLEAPLTSNPFVAEAKSDFNRFPSVSTFTYSGGLCTEKLEKIAFIVRKEVKDTITCINRYTYNDKGDLASWEYHGVYYYLDPKTRNHYSLVPISDTIRFEYEYDDHDNWIMMRFMLPDNQDAANTLLRNCSPSNVGEFELGGGAVAIIQRKIMYHAFSAEEELAMKKKDAPKLTAVQGYGLYGDVKTVTTNEHTVIFDEYGNVVSDGNSYTYQSPTQYKINNVIGSFRIICEDNIRREEDENGIELGTEYEFDKRGRVVRRRYTENIMPIEETYSYEGRDKYPSEMKHTESYEDGQDIYTCQYSYLEFDEQGNWTKRKVNRTWRIVMYSDGEDEISTKTDPEFVETRAITYF